jgi:hypothetical protein
MKVLLPGALGGQPEGLLSLPQVCDDLITRKRGAAPSVYGISSRHFCSQSSLASLSNPIMLRRAARSIQPFSSNLAIVVRPAGNSLENGSSRPAASFVSALRS